MIAQITTKIGLQKLMRTLENFTALNRLSRDIGMIYV
jgi:hypothetical protein